MIEKKACHDSAEKLTVGILIPVFNGRKFIEAALKSAFDQGAAVDEIVVVDNCSNDGTWEYLEGLQHPQLKRFRNETNVGLFGNFNRCLAHSTSDIVVFLCVDDQLNHGAVDHALMVFRAHPGIALLNTRGEVLDERLTKMAELGQTFTPGIYPGDKALVAILSHLARTGINPLNYPAGIYLKRRLATESDLNFDTSFQKCGDVDFYLRILMLGDFAVSSFPACRIRFHLNQQGQQKKEMATEIQEYFKIIDHPAIRERFSEQQISTLTAAFSGLALWRGLRFFAGARWVGFINHFRVAVYHCSFPRAMAACCVFIFRRLFMKLGKLDLGISPERPIKMQGTAKQ